jgi:NTP pyrophosphatase (non-canonical NTP hydrolase)
MNSKYGIKESDDFPDPPDFNEDLTLAEISAINAQRCEKWHGEADPWTSADWGNAVAGEVGEMCNVIKKLRRIETGVIGVKDPPKGELLNMLADEVADVYLYLDLLATHHNINLAEAIKQKFNAVSVREGFGERL